MTYPAEDGLKKCEYWSIMSFKDMLHEPVYFHQEMDICKRCTALFHYDGPKRPSPYETQRHPEASMGITTARGVQGSAEA